MEQFLSYFVFDATATAILSCMLVVLIIQIIFYINFYNKPLSNYNKLEQNPENKLYQPTVSVIIVAKNESENLAKTLPAILNQKYPDYEVIVVNDGSTDESDYLLKKLKLEYSHLYSTFSPEPYENESIKQKLLSMMIGIKAATKDVLLFTEADTCPLSENWISSMTERMTDEKDIVIGYCKYEPKGNCRKRIALFDHLLFTLQYMSLAIKGKPFTGLYKNLAYRKNLFFDNKGFSSSLRYDHAEDIFLNNIMTRDNTSVALSEDSFVVSDLDSFRKWRFIKSSYMKAKSHFKNFKPQIFSLETFSRYLFYLVFIGAVFYCSMHLLWIYLAITATIFITRYIIQYIVLKNASKHFQTKIFGFTLPFVELIQPLYNSYFKFYSRKKVKKKI